MEYVPYIAIMLAYALVFVPRMFVVRGEMAKLGGYNNRDPRAQQAQLEGRGRRALSAHHNSFEAFAPFAVGVLASIQRGANEGAIAYLSIAFVALRLIYIWAYVEDKPKLRSTVWSLGLTAIGLLMLLAVAGPHVF